MSRRLLCILTILGLPALAWTQSPLDELTATDLAEGEKIFKVHCARCHGIDGQVAKDPISSLKTQVCDRRPGPDRLAG